MSALNTLEQKRLRRIDRRARKAKARRAIRHCGVAIKKQDIRRHLYLMEHALPYSERLAAFASFVKVA